MSWDGVAFVFIYQVSCYLRETFFKIKTIGSLTKVTQTIPSLANYEVWGTLAFCIPWLKFSKVKKKKYYLNFIFGSFCLDRKK